MIGRALRGTAPGTSQTPQRADRFPIRRGGLTRSTAGRHGVRVQQRVRAAARRRLGGRQHRRGASSTLADGYSARLDDVAFAVDDDQPTAFYSPGRDEDGNLDPVEVNVALTEMHQESTFAVTADRIVAASR